MLDLEGKEIVSQNLTMDKETGIGNWTEEQFITAVKTGMRPDKSLFNYPMMPFASLTDKEVKAVWAYLNTLPVINNKIVPE